MEPISYQETVQKLLQIQSEDEWNQLALNVKRLHGGKYPEWWFPKIIQSGFANQILNRFGSSTDIKVRR